MTTTETLPTPAPPDTVPSADVPTDDVVRVDGDVAVRMLRCARWQQ